ncbi:hypothetical protein ACFWOJ_00625 [Streptomyces sp. NPDC058439]|uniref:hypothetical protein n=1 Tax=Streptomyces sp. NPDC058439 TaxID=3346500 RepID=UPI0036630059
MAAVAQRGDAAEDEHGEGARSGGERQVPAGAPHGARTDLTLTGRHRTVHLVEQGVRPGLVGVGRE